MARPFTKKTRCDYCAATATSWKWRPTRLYPSGRTVMTNAAACDQHKSCVAFVSMPGTKLPDAGGSR
jgi:hypothetical protein